MGTLAAYLISPVDQPRVRRAADATTVIVGLLLLSWAALTVHRHPPIDIAVLRMVAALPDWSDTVFSAIYVFGLLYMLVLLLLLVAGGRRHLNALRDVLIAGVIAAGAAAVLVRLYHDAWPYVLPEVWPVDPTPQLPVFRVAVLTAVLVAAAPHLARPMRRLGWAVVIAAALSGVGLGYGFPSDAVGAIGLGMISAGFVLLVLKSPSGYPDVEIVRAALSGLGLEFDEVRLDPDQSWGVRRLIGVGTDGRHYDIKAYGRDATDAQLLAKIWRGIWYKKRGPSNTYSRLQGVEHEALATMVAARIGASVPDVVAAVEPSDEVALLVTTRDGSGLHSLDAADVADELLAEVWRQVATLHAAGISHGNLSVHTVRLEADRPQLTDFLSASLVATDLERGFDVTELLFSLAVMVGPDRAVASAAAGLGAERMVAALPYLQLPALTRATKSEAEDAKSLMKELQEAAVDATGEEMPEQVQLRRVNARSLLMAALLFFAAYALIPMIAGIDFAAVWDVLRGADWEWIVVAFVVGHFVFVPEAFSMRYAAGTELPLWPTTLLQTSVRFIGLAIPSAAGRVAMNAAYLRKFGVSATRSVTQGAVDSLSGFVVEALILLVAFLAADEKLVIFDDSSDTNWAFVAFIGLVVVAGAVLAVRRIRKVRDLVMPMLRDSRDAVADVASSPTRVIGLLGSNLGARLIMALTLWLVLQGVGEPVSLAAALVAVVATSLLAGIVPIPGGIGVAEAFMTGVLTIAGVPEATAFAATVTYRMITFYLPAAEGFFAMKWLEARDYL